MDPVDPAKSVSKSSAGAVCARVLVVDDESTVLAALRIILKRAGYHADVADSYEAAVELLKRGDYDLLISDVHMPGHSGGHLLAYSLQEFPNLPVILMTGAPELDDAVSLVRRGAFDYLTKPFSPDTIVKRVSAALESRSQGSVAGRVAAAGRGDVRQLRVVRNLGSGASGDVALVEREQTLCVLRSFPGWTEHGPPAPAVAAFARDVAALAAVSHPGVIKVVEHDLAPASGVPYILMEHIGAESLDKFVPPTDLGLAQRLRLIRDAAAVLAAAHAAGVCHGDLGAADVLVSADFQVRIANFGLAALLRAAGASAAEQGGHGQADAPGADLFALGVLGYALITGFTPFAGEGFGDPRTSPPPDPGEFVPDLTESQARVLLDMLGAAPERPHRTAADAVGALDAALVPSGASNGQG